MRIYFISDIHFGASDPKRLYNELLNEFIEPLDKDDDVDLIVISGDLLHRKLSLNSDDSIYCHAFIERIHSIIKDKNIKLRIIQGTLTHDYDQLRNFNYLIESSDTKIVTKLYEETMHVKNKNYSILYVPEEYCENPDDYYSEAFSKNYNLCFGHGAFKFSGIHATSSERELKNAPVFDEDVFHDMVDLTFFGHIHKGCNSKNVYYPGSFSRFAFGETEDKGYFIVNYEPLKDDYKYNISFAINELATLYDTVKMSDLMNQYPDDVDKTEIIKHLNKMVKSENHKVRIINDLEDSLTNVMLKEIFSNEDNVKIEVKNSTTLDLEKDKIDERLISIVERKLNIYESISLWLDVTENYKIDPKELERILTSD